MFKCTECQAEYDIKPDYCDCGNDTFEEILPQKPAAQEPKKTVIQKEETKQEIKTYTPPKPIKTGKPFFDIPSTIIFSICIILSFVVVFFVGNPTDIPQVVKKAEPVKQTANIPNINKLWNNTPPKPEPKKIAIVAPQVQVTPQVQPIQVPQTVPVIPKPAKQTIATSTPKKQNRVPKTISKPQPQKATPQPTTQQTKPTVTTKPKQVIVQPVQQKPVQVQPTKQPIVVNKQELTNYKIALRNKLAGKMNFANVIGDGTCVVSFNISNSGALQNRKFKKQSSNFSLNDVVYNAVMQTPSYNPPPAAYMNEQMSLTVKIYNGDFEVSLY